MTLIPKQVLLDQQYYFGQNLNEAQKNLLPVEAQLLQYAMIELADEHPELVEIHLDANYEYDDEGGYFWNDSFVFIGKDGVELDDEDYSMYEKLRNVGAGEHAAALAFEGEDSFQASITVKRLREIEKGTDA